ncbi:MAG: insulinase family protein [Lachnospiraceae bacterium]|nr:insulinase family protein [Lachnospiraceae bacterium]
MNLKDLKGYELLGTEELKDIKSEGYILKHIKTGARVAVIANDDDNKCFAIGFRTPPKNSTGVAHIIEHSVLEGSEAFPVKDPFVELCKGSLNTFLNALTYPDKTLYPVASCNDLDLHNLIHVYMDAVLRPNIYKNKFIFLQEGWRYEMESEKDDLTINGIVYNEMKGAFSNVDDIIERYAQRSLYPHTIYGNESGGDPKDIPDLSYEEFLEFHKKFYHPSNSYIYLYGNVDAAKELDYIDKEYLSHYDFLDIDSSIGLEPAFKKRQESVVEYAVSDEDSEEGNYHYSLNFSIENALTKTTLDAIDVLDYALCSVPGAPLKEALIDAGIGDDVYSSFEGGIYQPYFSIIARNCNKEDKEEFLRIVEETLNDLVKNGIDKKALLAGINYYEFKYREADYGSYPKGLMYGLSAFDSWLYDDTKPFMHVLRNDTYAYLKKQVETDFFEKLIKKYLIDNKHQSFVTVKPVKGLTAREEKKLADKLKDIKKNLSKDEIKAIVKQTKELKEWQESEDTPEALATIPMLSIADLNRNAKKFVNDERKQNNVNILFHNIFTNGIAYIRLVFRVSGISEEDMCYLALYKNVLGLVSTSKHDYGELFSEIHLSTGGISPALNVYTDTLSREVIFTFDLKASVLYDNAGRAFELMNEMLFESDFTDKKRINDLVNELYTRFQSSILSSGNAFAYLRALRGTSKQAYLNDLTDGVAFFEKVEEWYKDFDSHFDEITAGILRVKSALLRKGNFMLDLTCDEDGYKKVVAYLPSLVSGLDKDESAPKPLMLNPKGIKEGLKNSAQIQFVACGGNYRDKGEEYTGVINVLKVMLAYDYLWSEIRVKGGAYGCMNMITRNGDGCFVSYRDPNLKETIEAFEACADYIENFEADESVITKYVIGAIGNLDTPLNPAARGYNSLVAYMSAITDEVIQKEREQVIDTSVEDIRACAKIVRAFMDRHSLCVVGNSGKIDENKDLFDTTRNIFTV